MNTQTSQYERLNQFFYSSHLGIFQHVRDILQLSLPIDHPVPHKVPFKSKILFVNARFVSSAECTIHNEHLVPYTKTKQKLQKCLDPNCQMKSDFKLKSSFLALDFGHKG